MQFPTTEEIEQACREIEAAGPMADDTMALSMLCLRNRQLADAVRRMTEATADNLGIDQPRRGIVQAMISSAVMTGLNYGLRVGDARVAAVTKARSEPSTALRETELWAWLGEDDQADEAKRTGEIGIKQCQTLVGLIPMVAVVRQKMEKFAHQFEAQAIRYGKRIRLCRFTFAEVVRETEHGT